MTSDLVQAIVLGIIQGLTEFLPVSSSGHLELAKFFLHDDSLAAESLLMTVTLHAATALATLLVFRKDVAAIFRGIFLREKEYLSFALKIILSMLPAVAVGLLLEEQIAQLFEQRILLVGAMLFVTGILLLFADRAKRTNKSVSYQNALVIGIAQAIAILPGISRSGATISTSVLLGIDRERAARFSFLMVVPLILGKMAKDLLDGEISSLQQAQWLPLAAGFTAAFFTGAAACIWMIRLVKDSKLTYFSVYCFVVATVAIVAYLT